MFRYASPRARRPFSFRLEVLEGRDVPAFLTGSQLVVGSDAGAPPVVRLTDPTTQARTEFLAFDPTFSGGVRVAVGDVTGDGYPDLVVGAGHGGGPAVKVYDGKTGSVVSTFFAYDPSFTGGVYVAVGDLDGDGKAEVITGAGGGGGPVVEAFNGVTGAPLGSVFAYDPSVRSGVRVAAGDLTGDGKAEVVTAPGPGGGPDVRTFQLAGSQLRQTGGFFAYDPSFTGGVSVAAGDVDGDGKAEIVTGTGPGGGPQVNVFTAGGRSATAFFAYDPSVRSGVRVAAADLTGDGKAEVLTGPGPGGGPQVNVYSLPSTAAATSLFGLPSDQMTGVFVAGSAKTLNIPPTPDVVISDAYAQVKAAEDRARQAAEAALQAAERARQVQLVPVPVGVPVPYYPYDPFYGAGFGLGLGFGDYYDPGFYAPVYDPVVVAPPTVIDPGFFGVGFDPGYYDPFGYSIGADYGYDF